MKSKKGLGKTFVSMLLILGMVINMVGIQAFAASTPAEPSIYYAKSNSYNSALIKWTPLEDVDGYRLYRKLSNTSWKLVAEIKGATKSSYKDTGLSCGETYYYTLRSFKGNKASSYNKTGIAVKIVPATPKLVAASAVSTSSAKITWEKVSGASGYLVYCSETSTKTGWKKIATVKSGSTVSYTQTGLTAGKAYAYTVKAYRTVNGSNIYSGYQSPGLLTCTTPNRPKLVSAVGSYNSIKITWSKVSYATHYFVYRKVSTGWKKIATVTGNSVVSYTDTDVTLGSSYTYTVKASVKKTDGTWNSAHDGNGISATVAPATPTIKGLSAVTCTSLKLTWSKVAGATGYRVYRKGPNDKSWQNYTTIRNGSTVTFTDTGLTCGQTYTYTVRAYTTQNKKTVWSGYNTKGYSSQAKPAAPSLTNAYALSETAVRVSYGKVSDADGYIVYRKVNSESSWHKIATLTKNDITKYDDKNCKINTTYTYTVRAYKTVKKTNILSSYNSKGVSVKVNEKTRVEKNQDLQKINSDFQGWLQINNTIVDFPVMQDPYDDETYLRRDMYGNHDDDGCLILDSNCNIGTGTKGNYSTLPSSNLIIYGHKRPDTATSGMFRDLADYRDKSYANSHKYITLTTTSETRKYQVMAAFYSEVYKKTDDCFKYYEQYNFFTESEFKYFYNNVKKLSLYDTGVTASFGDEFVTLTTCAWYDQNGNWVGQTDDDGNNTGRFVLIAKRIS